MDEERPMPVYCTLCDHCIKKVGHTRVEYSCGFFRDLITHEAARCKDMRTGNACPGYEPMKEVR